MPDRQRRPSEVAIFWTETAVLGGAVVLEAGATAAGLWSWRVMPLLPGGTLVSRNQHLYQLALQARDNTVNFMQAWPRNNINRVATVVGGYNKVTGEVGVGVKFFRTGSFCGESEVVNRLGGIADEIVMTPAIRPAVGPPAVDRIISVCPVCQLRFTADNFGAGATFDIRGLFDY